MQSNARVALAYKSHSTHNRASHFGLGVTALNNAKVLRKNGIAAEVWPVESASELRCRLDRALRDDAPVTHVVMSAPWIASADWQALSTAFGDTRFAVTCHSNLGFLQADPSAVRLVREGIEIERASWNFHVAGNSHRFCDWVTKTFNAACSYLPNLYYVDLGHVPKPSRFHGGTLRIGAFGATRQLKNLVSAAGAAMQLSSDLRTDVELWVSASRYRHGDSTTSAIREMTCGTPRMKLIENGWQSWPQFRETVGHMHLLMQPSYTETFNVVTADGVAEGVPSVVSEAIDWAPDEWKARVDDVADIARVAREILDDRRAASKGWRALEKHNSRALEAWLDFLKAPVRQSWWNRLF
ncbi:MAG: hypothetical protein M3Z23_11740 [Acidobacteriota bacterium]|nr:hypothetical protein [Acidobacteriota bacterium]